MTTKTYKVTTKHPQYIAKQWLWKSIRDANEGESAIKQGNTMYLPMPAGMSVIDTSPTTGGIGADNNVLNAVSGKTSHHSEFLLSDPSYHTNPAYMAYKKRAHFPDNTASSMRGLTGLAKRGSPELELPSELQYLEKDATKDGKTLQELYNNVVHELLLQGRITLFADIDDKDGEIKMVPIKAKSLINWKEDKDGLTLSVYEKAAEEDDEFSHSNGVNYCVSRIGEVDDESGSVYNVTVYDDEDGIIEQTVAPSYKGNTLSYIPAVVCGSTEIKTDVDVVPMQGIANTSIQMYQKSADLSMSEYMSCNPMLTLTGVADGEAPKTVGSTVMLVMENDAAKAFYPATDTSALSHVMAHMDKLEKEAISYGANLLGGGSNKAEAAETLRIRQYQNGATLLSVVDTAGKAITQMLKIISEWKTGKKSEAEIKYEGNKEFSNIALTAQEQTALVQQWMANGISDNTYLWNLHRAGLLKGTVEEEKNELASQPPKLSMMPAPTKEEPTKEDE